MSIREITGSRRPNVRSMNAIGAGVAAMAVAILANGVIGIGTARADTVSVPPPCDTVRAVTESVRDQISGKIKRAQPSPGKAQPAAGSPAKSAGSKPARQASAPNYEQRLADVESRIARKDIRVWVTAHVRRGSDAIGINAGPNGVTVDCPVFFDKWKTPNEQLNVLLFESGKALAAIVKDKADRWREEHAAESPETDAFKELNTLAASTPASKILAMAEARGGQKGSGVDPLGGSYENTVGVLFRELALKTGDTGAAKPAAADDPVGQMGNFIRTHPLSSSLMRAR